MSATTAAEIVLLLRGFFAAYRERFDDLVQRSEGVVPVLHGQSLDVVRVNGGRSLHFFFTSPEHEAQRTRSRGATRLHDVALWPDSTNELKGLEEGAPNAHREQVRKTAAIEGSLYLHFVVYPEDGQVPEVLADVARRVAEKEALAQGVAVAPPEEPGAAGAEDGGEDDGGDVGSGRDWIQPAP